MRPKLYSTPFIVAWVMLIIGLLGAFNLAYIPLISDINSGGNGGFAFTAIGVFIIIIAVLIFAVYGKLNNDFRKMIAGETLLTYVMPFDIYQFFSRKEAEDIKGGNKLALFMILGFCILFGVIFGFAIDKLFFVIFLGISVFFTIIFVVTTAFRTNKVKKSQALVCLNTGGAYVFGQMNSWSMTGTRPVSIGFFDSAPNNLPCPVIQITYIAAAVPVSQQHAVTVPVPSHFVKQALWAVDVIKKTYGI